MSVSLSFSVVYILIRYRLLASATYIIRYRLLASASYIIRYSKLAGGSDAHGFAFDFHFSLCGKRFCGFGGNGDVGVSLVQRNHADGFKGNVALFTERADDVAVAEFLLSSAVQM